MLWPQEPTTSLCEVLLTLDSTVVMCVPLSIEIPRELIRRGGSKCLSHTMGGRKVFLNRNCVGSTRREGADQAASNAPYDSPKSGTLYLSPHAGLQSTQDLSHDLVQADLTFLVSPSTHHHPQSHLMSCCHFLTHL